MDITQYPYVKLFKPISYRVNLKFKLLWDGFNVLLAENKFFIGVRCS